MFVELRGCRQVARLLLLRVTDRSVLRGLRERYSQRPHFDSNLGAFLYPLVPSFFYFPLVFFNSVMREDFTIKTHAGASKSLLKLRNATDFVMLILLSCHYLCDRSVATQGVNFAIALLVIISSNATTRKPESNHPKIRENFSNPPNNPLTEDRVCKYHPIL